MEDLNPINDSWIPDTALQWFNWLTSEECKTRNAYLAKPATLIANYRQEKSITRDYEGREVLELLQNSADQARESQVIGRVVIELLPEGLIVANTGAAFSIGGVLSLETANLSPKWRKRRRFIGSKGLGFRSVLNWSHSPIILSGALSLSYNPSYSKRILSELLGASSELVQRVREENGESDELILPLLPFPGYCESGQLDALIKEDAAKLLLSRCKTWRNEGYDTVVGMPFNHPNAYEAAKEQLSSLRPEILLFVDHLDELRFVTSNVPDRIWRFEGDDTLSMVTENNEPLGLWQIHRTSGTIPEELLDPDQTGPLDFEIVVAVPDIEDPGELRSSPLFSHFPTEIDLPLPVVCHATLELNQSRNHTQQRNSNRYVLDRLATFLAEIAERRSAQYPSGPNAGFRLLLPLKSYPNDLTREKFHDQLIFAAKNRAIVPTLSGKAICPKDARMLPGTDAVWLPAISFPEVVSFEDSKEKEFFIVLGVPELQSEELRTRLIELKTLPIRERAALIIGLLRSGIDRAVYSSSLLLDSSGDPVPDSTQVFLAPSAGTPPSLPAWMSLRFLHDGLRVELMQQSKSQDVRDLQGKLSSFGVLEYSLANLIRRLVAAANRYKKSNPEIVASVDEDLRTTVYSLFLSEGKSGKRPEYPDNVSLPLPNQAGTTSAADDLYFGRGFGTHGNILQALYDKWAPEKLVVTPDQMRFVGDRNQLHAFLVWAGVAEWPREVFIDNPGDGFLDFVLGKITYPAKFEDYLYQPGEKVQNASLKKIRSVDGLKDILQHAGSAAITAWLALDSRIHQWVRPQMDHAELTSIYSSDRNLRTYRNLLPYYPRWKVENKKWIPNESGEFLRPRDCVLGQRAIEALFPRPQKPSPEDMELFGVIDADLVEGWRRAGVLTSLAELELDDIYARLTELPERDPEGRLARALYRWLLDASDLAMGSGTAARERFINSGKMWGYHGGIVGYYPVTELRHADSEGLPSSLSSNLKIVDLPYRVGADKVERVFGVRPIDRMGIGQRVRSFQLAANLDDDFQQAKPFLFLLRTSQTSQTQYLKTLKSMSLKVCSELTAVVRYEDNEFEFIPPVWGWLIENDVVYIRSDPAEPIDIAPDLLADSIGAAIASIFRIGDGGEFARMFLCKQKDRKTLLQRMRGEAAEENMEQIIAEFGISDTTVRVAAMPASQPIQEPIVKAGQPEDREVIEPAPDISDQADNFLTNQPNIGPLIIEHKPHSPSGPPERHDLRIQKTTGGRIRTTTMNRVTDGAFCERKAIEFEETSDPPRYPLLVGQITGSSAFGCDVISFATPEDREAFRSGANRQLDKILRFIEVKGRKSESGAIELKGNERNAAITHKKRFFIYRLFKSGTDEYQLCILQDPIEQKEALEPAVYVDLNRANTTERFLLTGGLQEGG